MSLNVKENEPLSKHTNFRIGGPARWFVEARSEADVREAITFAKEQRVSYCVIGGGSNVLVSDEGFSGVVIQMAMRGVHVQRDFSPVEQDATSGRAGSASGGKVAGNTLVVAEAGALSTAVARQTADVGLQGLEWAVSLPGTIGGAVRGNAGCFGGEMKDSVVSVRVLRDGDIVEIGKDEAGFSYRESAFKHSNDIILSVTLALHPGDRGTLRQKLDETLAKRKASQPHYGGSAGCLFKNHDATDEELQRLARELDVLPYEMSASRRIPAGWLIDKLGLKGTRIGDAEISQEHGNFVVNLGKATASDVVQIIALVKTKSRDQFGIQLQEEVQYLGFSH
jgi:UDP-N-acetylmuramate dehydrogenase